MPDGKTMTEALAALAEVEDYFDQRADVNWEGTGPNEAMQMLTEVREVIARIKAAFP